VAVKSPPEADRLAFSSKRFARWPADKDSVDEIACSGGGGKRALSRAGTLDLRKVDNFLPSQFGRRYCFSERPVNAQPFSWPTREQGLGAKNGKPAKRQLKLSY
jgi:hypothetical protein